MELSARHRSVARCIVSGYDNHQIAEQLKLTPTTIAVYVHFLLDACGCDSRGAVKLHILARPRLLTYVFETEYRTPSLGEL
jgi:DNA-binding NarL/FixJ family response regulator